MLPTKALEEIYKDKSYITVNKIKRSWGIYHQVMVCKKSGSKIVFRTSLARVLLNAPKFTNVDHIDGNPLNNDLSNLRLASHSENGANRKKTINTTSKFKGVRNSRGKFYAQCKQHGVTYSAGPFFTELEAAYAYNKLSTMVFGPYAKINEISKAMGMKQQE